MADYIHTHPYAVQSLLCSHVHSCWLVSRIPNRWRTCCADVVLLCSVSRSVKTYGMLVRSSFADDVDNVFNHIHTPVVFGHGSCPVRLCHAAPGTTALLCQAAEHSLTCFKIACTHAEYRRNSNMDERFERPETAGRHQLHPPGRSWRVRRCGVSLATTRPVLVGMAGRRGGDCRNGWQVRV